MFYNFMVETVKLQKDFLHFYFESACKKCLMGYENYGQEKYFLARSMIYYVLLQIDIEEDL